MESRKSTDERRQDDCKRPGTATSNPTDPCIRAINEDDDGYDPYSDRRPPQEPLWEPDPWR